MNFYLAVALLWLVVIPCVLAGCCGLWAIAVKGWRAWLHARDLERLWDDTAPDAWERENISKTGGGVQPLRRGLTETPTPVPPRVRVLARSRPYDQERGDAA